MMINRSMAGAGLLLITCNIFSIASLVPCFIGLKITTDPRSPFLDGANALIAHNKERLGKNLRSIFGRRTACAPLAAYARWP